MCSRSKSQDRTWATPKQARRARKSANRRRGAAERELARRVARGEDPTRRYGDVRGPAS